MHPRKGRRDAQRKSCPPVSTLAICRKTSAKFGVLLYLTCFPEFGRAELFYACTVAVNTFCPFSQDYDGHFVGYSVILDIGMLFRRFGKHQDALNAYSRCSVREILRRLTREKAYLQLATWGQTITRKTPRHNWRTYHYFMATAKRFIFPIFSEMCLEQWPNDYWYFFFKMYQ